MLYQDNYYINGEKFYLKNFDWISPPFFYGYITLYSDSILMGQQTQKSSKKYGIITAMEEEAQIIIDFLWLTFVKEYQTIKIYENQDYVLALTGIWKIQASMGTMFLCLSYDVEGLINIGIAGNLTWKESKVWDVFLVHSVVQHDMYLPFEWSHLDYAKWAIILPYQPHINLDDFPFGVHLEGKCATWDQFIDRKDLWDQLREKTQADIAEMEAFWVASVAREFWILPHTIIIKAISDGADSDAIYAHESNLEFAMNNSLEVLKKILEA